MKTPIQEANEIVANHRKIIDFFNPETDPMTNYLTSVKLAIIGVELILDLANRPDLFKMRNKRQHLEKSEVDRSYLEYWQATKKEIEKMI